MGKQPNLRSATLIFLRKIVDDITYICLAEKKRGFAVGKWNGVGGKLEEGESVEQAAVREAFEEISVTIEEPDLQKVALITFTFDEKPGWDQMVHVFLVDRWEGEPQETEEMRPEWYALNSLPYGLMWEDDIHWLPRVLQGERLNADFHFDSEERIASQNIVPAYASF